MNPLKDIISYFFKHKNNHTGNQINEGNAIVFSLNPSLNNEPHIKIKIEDTSDEASKKFAEMLFDINIGSYNESALHLLARMSEEDDEIKKFVETTIIYWGFLMKDKKHLLNASIVWKQKPLIMPTDFNKHAK